MRKEKMVRIINGPKDSSIGGSAVKFWNIAETNENEGIITLYGQIVSRHPVNWFSGEKASGLFISPEGFLEDLSLVKDKSNITIRINSVGGDLYTGMAIYTQLKSLAGYKTVIVDGIAASAASLIAMAGDLIKIPAGSQMMIHEPQGQVNGMYKQKDLQQIALGIESAANSAAETYANKTKLSVETIKKLMADETWMTGREAVEKGFADELLFDTVSMSMTADLQTLTVNGLSMSIAGIENMPATIPVAQSIFVGKPPLDDNKKGLGGEQMYKTMEELIAAHPDFVSQIKNAAQAEGVAMGITQERGRIKGIEDIQAAIPLDLATEAKFGEKPLTAQELAFNAMQLQAKQGEEYLKSLMEDSKKSGIEDVGSVPNGGTGEKTPEQEMNEAVSMIIGGGKNE